MKLSIKFLIILFFIITGPVLYSQNYKFKTSSLSVSTKNEKGKWGEWSAPKNVNLIVTLDTKKNRIVVYSQIIQLFEIVEYYDTDENDIDKVDTFYCKDNQGEECTLSIITRKKQENRKQLYINYEDRIIVYNLI